MLKQTLNQALLNNDYHFSDEIENQFLIFLTLLERWNKVFNLTAIRDPSEMVLLHLLDSLSINPYLHGTTMLDVGTGAGLPGIPLAIINRDKKWTLLDSNSKKTRFLTHVKQELKLTNVEIIHTRAECWRPHHCFDSIISRAFSSLSEMVEMTQHLLCPNGQFLAMKGVYPEKEIEALPKTTNVLAVHPLKIKGLDAQRCLVCLTAS